MAVPDYDAFIADNWGWPIGLCEWWPLFGAAGYTNNTGSNPPFALTDFLSIYPQFGGLGTQITCELDADSNVLRASEPFQTGPGGIEPGMGISGPDIPIGTVVTIAIDDEITFTVNQPMPYFVAAEQVTYYPSGAAGSYVPPAVTNAYIALANASLDATKWGAGWYIGMCNFIAHYCTLWLRSYGVGQGNFTSAGQLASAGLEKGILISKSAGDVSAGSQLVTGIEDWGAYQETTFGVQYATVAAGIGSRPVFCW